MSIFSLVRSRIFIALLVLAVALTVAAACNGDDDGGETPARGETPAGGETPGAGGATAEIKMIPGTQFDKAELTIAADTDVEVTADNTDGTHSFAVYTDDTAQESLGKTEICAAPCTDTVTLNVAAGEYFFRCEVHTTRMTGTLHAE